jgi:hypothetical protein
MSVTLAEPLIANPPATTASSLAATLHQLGIHTSETLDSLCVLEGRKPYVVESLICTGAIGLVVGDSGLGKSPLIYQLALCVAAGIPWLGMRTSEGPVVYLDCENGPLDSQALRDSLLQHLGLPKCPNSFFSCYNVSDINPLAPILKAIKPVLVIIDTLRSFDPNAEENNTKAGRFIRSLRGLCQEYKTSFLIIHHTKKPQQSGGLFPSANLEVADSSLQWLNQACGARALVNQTDFRVGIDQASQANASLVVRGHVRVRGEFGPFFLTRAFDDDEQPIGYRRLSGVEFLINDQQAAFNKLPLAFTFKVAKTEYGRKDQATVDFLKKCIQLGIVKKVERGKYEKVVHATAE